MSAVVGYGRLGWNVGAWNSSPDAIASITGQQILPSVNFGFGWGRESWSEGAWNTNIGLVFTGNGVIFSTTGQQANTALNFSIAQASAQTSITGINANANLGSVVTTGFDLEVDLGNITTGSANIIDITGEEITSSLGTISTDTENFIPITGIHANANAGSFIISSEQILNITGQSMTISLASIIPDSNNFLNMTGIQANVTPVDLRFWDNITDGNTYTWTNL